MRLRLDNKGFSLIEVFFSILIMGIVVVSFYKLPTFFTRAEKSVSTVVTKDRLFKNFSQSFIQIAERSDLALRFQNLPIPTSCQPGRPCIRRLDRDGGKNEIFSDVSFADLSAVQFFRDEQGELKPKDLLEEKNIKILSRVPYSFERTFLEGEYYSTWPLVDADSNPFVIMKRGELADHFLVEDAFGSSRKINDWVIVKGTRRGIDLNKLSGRPMMIYDLQDPSQFVGQRVVEAQDCSLAAFKTHCHEIAKEINPKFLPTEKGFAEIGDSNMSKTFDEIPFYLFRTKPYEASDFRFQASKPAAGSANRGRNFLPNTSSTPTSWVGQESAFYLFPSLVASIYSVGSPPAPDLVGPVDAKRLAHFTHVVPGGAFAMLPFDLVSYQLEDMYQDEGGKSVKRKDGKKQLVSHSFATQSSDVVLADIEEKDEIIFARRLGRSEISVFHLKGAKSVTGGANEI